MDLKDHRNTALWRGIIHGYMYNGKRSFEVYHQEHFLGGFITATKTQMFDWFHEEESNGDIIVRDVLPNIFEKNTDDEFFAEVVVNISIEYFRCGEYGEEWDADVYYDDEQIRYIPKEIAIQYDEEYHEKPTLLSLPKPYNIFYDFPYQELYKDGVADPAFPEKGAILNTITGKMHTYNNFQEKQDIMKQAQPEPNDLKGIFNEKQ